VFVPSKQDKHFYQANLPTQELWVTTPKHEENSRRDAEAQRKNKHPAFLRYYLLSGSATLRENIPSEEFNEAKG
jgi:hypothetical protein